MSEDEGSDVDQAQLSQVINHLQGMLKEKDPIRTRIAKPRKSATPKYEPAKRYDSGGGLYYGEGEEEGDDEYDDDEYDDVEYPYDPENTKKYPLERVTRVAGPPMDFRKRYKDDEERKAAKRAAARRYYHKNRAKIIARSRGRYYTGKKKASPKGPYS